MATLDNKNRSSS